MNRSELLEKLARELDEWPTPDNLPPLTRYGEYKWQVIRIDNKEVILNNRFDFGGYTAISTITKQQWLDEKNRLEKIDNNRVSFSLSDTVNHPDHYTQGKVECIDAIESATID